MNNMPIFNPMFDAMTAKMAPKAPLPTEIRAYAGAFELVIEVPGVNKDDIKVLYKKPELILEITKKTPEAVRNEEFGEGEVVSNTRVFGKCTYRFNVPKAEPEKIQVALKDGVLVVLVPLRKEKENEEIEITIK